MKALILTALICGLPLMAHAQDWRPYFSEENNGETVCAGGIDGLRCNGGYCDNISLACKAGAIGAAAGGWSPWFSEERPNNIFRCQRGTVATGMRCDGGNCDNLSVRCDPVPDKVLSDCRTTAFISEERPNNSAFFGNDRVLVGVECRGSNCDNKRLEHCAVADRVAEIGQPEAGWEIVISGGQTVSVDVTESVSLTRSTSDSWSEETGRSLSLKINAGVGIGDLKLGAETGATLSSTHGRAAQLARTVDRSYEASCGHEIDMVAYELHAVWQWVLNVAVDGEPVKMRTCQITCMHDGRAPDYAPGHPLDIGACRSGPPLMPNPVAPAQVLERPLDLGETFAPKPVRSLDLR